MDIPTHSLPPTNRERREVERHKIQGTTSTSVNIRGKSSSKGVFSAHKVPVLMGKGRFTSWIGLDWIGFGKKASVDPEDGLIEEDLCVLITCGHVNDSIIYIFIHIFIHLLPGLGLGGWDSTTLPQLPIFTNFLWSHNPSLCAYGSPFEIYEKPWPQGSWFLAF